MARGIRRRACLASALSGALTAIVACSPRIDSVRCEDTRQKMGTSFRLVVYAHDGQVGQRAIEAGFARIDELNAILSDYEEQSELSRLSGRSLTRTPTGPLPVSDELWTVLFAAREVAEESAGAFDVTVGPFVKLWRRSSRQGELPTSTRLEQAAGAVGFAKLRLDEDSRRVELLAPGMRLDLGGIAKGYALDECLKVLREHGIESALVDGGGDLAVGAPPPGQRGWRVVLEPLAGSAEIERLSLSHVAVASSGDTRRFVEIDGRRYSHVIDPLTGLGLTRRIGASVIAPSGMLADALCSAACVLGPGKGIELLERAPGVEGRIVAAEPVTGELSTRRTAGFARFGAREE